MVDITNFCFTKISAAVKALYSTAKVSKTYQNTTTVFPYVTFIDLDNPETSHALDYTHRKSHPSWQIDIYMNGGTGETVAKQIRDAIVSIMEIELHMNRVIAKPVTNVADPTIYRYMIVYDCRLDEDTGRISS